MDTHFDIDKRREKIKTCNDNAKIVFMKEKSHSEHARAHMYQDTKEVCDCIIN